MQGHTFIGLSMIILCVLVASLGTASLLPCLRPPSLLRNWLSLTNWFTAQGLCLSLFSQVQSLDLSLSHSVPGITDFKAANTAMYFYYFQKGHSVQKISSMYATE